MEGTGRWVRVGHASGATGFEAGFVAAGEAAGDERPSLMRGVLGEDGIQREIGRVTEHSSGAPVAGFYTYGEIARTQGITGFHNQTLVVLAVS